MESNAKWEVTQVIKFLGRRSEIEIYVGDISLTAK